MAADMIGMDFETVSYVLGMFACYPLGMIMAQIPYGATRHFFSFFLGAFLLQLTLGVQWIHLFISVMISYLMMLVLPRRVLKTALPVFAMTYMTFFGISLEATTATFPSSCLPARRSSDALVVLSCPTAFLAATRCLRYAASTSYSVTRMR